MIKLVIEHFEAFSGTLTQLEMLTTSLQFICERISRIRDDYYQDRLDIKQVYISNYMEVILRKFAVAAVKFPLTLCSICVREFQIYVILKAHSRV